MMAFLDYLYSPVVGDESYQTTIGRLPDIQVLRNWFDARNLGSPSNHIGVYTQYLFAEHFLQIDWMGRVISTKNYRGEWSLATAQSATEYYKVDKTYHRRTFLVLCRLDYDRWGERVGFGAAQG